MAKKPSTTKREMQAIIAKNEDVIDEFVYTSLEDDDGVYLCLMLNGKKLTIERSDEPMSFVICKGKNIVAQRHYDINDNLEVGEIRHYIMMRIEQILGWEF